MDRPWRDVPKDWTFTEHPFEGRPAVWVRQPNGLGTIYEASNEEYRLQYEAALAEARARKETGN